MEHHCTTRSAMNHIVAPRPVEPAVSDFYKHPYGGIARDIFVSYEGFLRFFEQESFDLDAPIWNGFYGKVVDTVLDDHELLGYRGHHRGVDTWMITIIDRSSKARYRHLKRSLNQMSDTWKEVGKKAYHAATDFRSALPHSTN